MSVILSPRGNEASNMMKRFVRYEEAAQYFGIDETLIVAYAKVAGAVYQLSKIRLIKIEPLEDYMKHLTRVGRSSKLIQILTFHMLQVNRIILSTNLNNILLINKSKILSKLQNKILHILYQCFSEIFFLI